MPEQQQQEQQQEQQEQKQAQWYDGFDADLKANPSIQKFKGPADLAKSYLELQKNLGKEKVVIPTEKSTPEEVREFWKKLGAPEKAEDYEIADEDLPEEFRAMPQTKEEFRKAMFEQGTPKKFVDAAWNFYKANTLKQMNQQIEELKNLRGTTETALRSKWGAAYDAKVERAQGVINKFFADKGLRKEFNIFSSDKGFIEGMAEIAELLSEDVIAGKPRVTMTPEEATSEYNAMLGDKKHPLHNELHPEHEAAVEKFNDLQRMMMAGQG